MAKAKELLKAFARAFVFSWLAYSFCYMERELELANLHILTGTTAVILSAFLIRLLLRQPDQSHCGQGIFLWISGKVVLGLIVQMLSTLLLSLCWSWLLDDASGRGMVYNSKSLLPLGCTLISYEIYLECCKTSQSDEVDRNLEFVLAHFEMLTI